MILGRNRPEGGVHRKHGCKPLGRKDRVIQSWLEATLNQTSPDVR